MKVAFQPNKRLPKYTSSGCDIEHRCVNNTLKIQFYTHAHASYSLRIPDLVLFPHFHPGKLKIRMNGRGRSKY